MAPLDVDHNVGVEEKHRTLPSLSAFGLLPKNSRVGWTIDDITPRADNPLRLPVSDQSRSRLNLVGRFPGSREPPSERIANDAG